MTEFLVFNEKILEWALRRANYTPEDLSKKFKFIHSWLEGKTKPTIVQTQELSKFLDVPFGYFCLKTPPEEPPLLPDFRTKGNHPIRKMSLGLRKTIEHAKECQAFLSERFEKAGVEPFGYTRVIDLKTSVEDGARALKDILKEERITNQDNRFKRLVKKIENLNVLVQKNKFVLNSTKHRLDSKEFRGFALSDKFCPLIFINENDSFRAQIFTLIHEFCHILLEETGLSGVDTNSNEIEKFCDRITVEYLVPAKEFKTSWEELEKQEKNVISIQKQLANKFCVSQWVIVRRANELGFIDNATYEKILNKLLNFENYPVRNTEGGPDYKKLQQSRLGSLLIENAVKAAYSGEILFTDAMRLTMFSEASIQKVALQMEL